MKKLISVLLSLLLLLGLTGCGAASNSTMASKAEAPAAAVAAEEMTMEMAMDTGAGLRAQGQSAESAPPENRKWVITMYLSAETEDLDAMLQTLDNDISAAGGYIETKNIFHGSSRNEYRYRNANLILRIPADRTDSFVENVGSYANLISQEKQLEDITLTYVATESRMKALQTEEARLLELLAQAENMEDLLAIEARLSQVRTELETVTSQMRIFDNQVDYATIHLSIQEVRQYTPVEEPGFFERISRTFANSLEGLADGAVDVTVWVLGNSPYLAVCGLLIFLLMLLFRKLPKWKHREKKSRKKPGTPPDLPPES